MLAEMLGSSLLGLGSSLLVLGWAVLRLGTVTSDCSSRHLFLGTEQRGGSCYCCEQARVWCVPVTQVGDALTGGRGATDLLASP